MCCRGLSHDEEEYTTNQWSFSTGSVPHSTLNIEQQGSLPESAGANCFDYKLVVYTVTKGLYKNPEQADCKSVCIRNLFCESLHRAL